MTSQKPKFELLPLNIEAAQNNSFLFQILPFVIGLGIFLGTPFLNGIFNFTDQYPQFYKLMLSILLLVCSTSYIVVIIQKEYIRVIIVRGKPAVAIGIVGFSFFFLSGMFVLFRILFR